MSDTLQLIERYLRAIERGDEGAVRELLDDDVVLHEHPNALNKAGRVQTREDMLAGLRRGKAVTRDERYVVTNAVVDGARAALELEWSATIVATGQAMHARIASFVEVRDGRIVRQAQYDCFLP